MTLFPSCRPAEKGVAVIVRGIRKHHYIIVVSTLVLLFVLENTLLLGISGLLSYNLLYFLKIALWAALGAAILKFPAAAPGGLIRLRKTVASLAFTFALFHLLGYVILGFFTSFSKSTMDLSPLGTLSNIAAMSASLFGGEMCRSFLLNGPSGKKPFVRIAIISVLFALFSISLGNIAGLGTRLDILDFIAGSVFPQLAQSFAASCLAYLAGPVPAMIYLGIIRTFDYVSPYVPNPSEIPKLLFSVLFPLISIALIMKIYAGEASEFEKYRDDKTGAFGWTVVSVLSVAMVWFSVGIFPVFPSVILTGSMEPGIMPGDIVIVEKTGGEGVDVGDVVMYYSEDGMNITHRVIEKSASSGDTRFITKGDNNSSADSLSVAPGQIRGRVIFTVPKLGKLALYLRSAGDDRSPS